MFKNFPLFPEAASTAASKIDGLFLSLVALSGVMTLLIFALVIYFAIRYRRRSEDEIPAEVVEHKALEIGWIVIPFIIFMGLFFWSASIYFKVNRIPANALTVHVVGKQWMWKFQHPSGQSEINALHVPVGRPIRLVLGSEDVIHSFFVPAFRVHTDVLPNRFRYTWFQATRTGAYHLFCSQYCGTEHSGMIGTVYVMEPGDYQEWLAGGPELSPAKEGEKLFQKLACNTCHTGGPGARGPELAGLLGSTVRMQNGATLVADENYIRESIMTPKAKVVAGFEPIMPSFDGQVSEEQILQLISYIRTLAPQQTATGVAGTVSKGGMEAIPNQNNPQSNPAAPTAPKTGGADGKTE